jgi:hypothetical protein
MVHENALNERVAEALSPERLAPYRRVVGGDLGSAIELYVWNLAVSGAFYEALGILEVVVRNALDAQLTEAHGSLPGYWYDDPRGVFSDHAHKDIAQARSRVAKMHHPETHGRVIAELNFGFWKFLLAKRYEATLWTGHLRHAFPNLQPQRRDTAFRTRDALHTLRNRVAHHEPIHQRDLAADMLATYRLLGWIDEGACEWALTLSRLESLLAQRPW